MVSNTCYPNIQEVEAGGSRVPGQPGLFHETLYQRRNSNSQAPPLTYREHRIVQRPCALPPPPNFTPGLNQGQHSWGEGNRKGLKEGRKTVSLWRPLWLTFSSASLVPAWGIPPLLQACRCVKAEWSEMAWAGTGL